MKRLGMLWIVPLLGNFTAPHLPKTPEFLSPSHSPNPIGGTYSPLSDLQTSVAALNAGDLVLGVSSQSVVGLLSSSTDDQEPLQTSVAQAFKDWTRATRSHFEMLALDIRVERVTRKLPSDLGWSVWSSDQSTEQTGSSQLQHCPRSPFQSEQHQRRATVYQVWIEHDLIAEFPQSQTAQDFANRLQDAIYDTRFDPERLYPEFIDGKPGAKVGETVLFKVDGFDERFLGRNRELLAIAWVNNLRHALDAQPIPLADAQTQLYGLTDTSERLEGIASWYGPYFHGRKTAAGETFDQNEFTAAHPSLPFDTYLKVTNIESGESVVVRVNDRGPYVGIRSLDLSREAARCIGSEVTGVVPYEAVILSQAEPTDAESDEVVNTQNIAHR